MEKSKIIEEKGIDIALYNKENATAYASFFPENITNFKSFEGKVVNKIVYLKEVLEILCGNEEIIEYVFVDKAFAQKVEKGEKKSFGNCDITISSKKHFFARNVYTMSFNLDGIDYLVEIKTSVPNKVDIHMKNFFEKAKKIK